MQEAAEVKIVAVNTTTGIDWASGPDYSVTVLVDLAAEEAVVVDLIPHKVVNYGKEMRR